MCLVHSIPMSALVSYSNLTHTHTQMHTHQGLWPPNFISRMKPDYSCLLSLQLAWHMNSSLTICMSPRLSGRALEMLTGVWSGLLPCPPGSAPPPGASSALTCTCPVISTCCVQFIIFHTVLMSFLVFFFLSNLGFQRAARTHNPKIKIKSHMSRAPG